MTQHDGQLLPHEFHDLEPFARGWSIERESDRVEKRVTTSMADIEAFYDAVMPRMDEILAYLNPFPLDAMPEPETRLLWLILSLAEISPAIHFYGQQTVVNGFDVRKFGGFEVPNFGIPGDRPAEIARPQPRRRS